MKPNQLITNEWIDAKRWKPWVKRMVLIRLADRGYDIAYWNGVYWCTQGGRPYHEDGNEITHFYIFERYIPKPIEIEK